jgi:hypothetical protein
MGVQMGGKLRGSVCVADGKQSAAHGSRAETGRDKRALLRNPLLTLVVCTTTPRGRLDAAGPPPSAAISSSVLGFSLNTSRPAWRGGDRLFDELRVDGKLFLPRNTRKKDSTRQQHSGRDGRSPGRSPNSKHPSVHPPPCPRRPPAPAA